jgi:hypothetical protein
MDTKVEALMSVAGRVYSVEGNTGSQAGAIDFLEMLPADDHPCLLLALIIGQTTEFGDAQDEMVEYLVKRGGTLTSGSGGAAPTPRPSDFGDGGAGFTVEVGNTTKGSFTSGVNVHRGAFNIRAGLELFWTPETAIKFGQANQLIVEQVAAPVDAVTWTVCAYIQEL